jgi:hypothetical protein
MFSGRLPREAIMQTKKSDELERTPAALLRELEFYRAAIKLLAQEAGKDWTLYVERVMRKAGL